MPSEDYVTKCLKHIKNNYLLTIIVAKRTNQLNNGAKPLLENTNNLTNYEIALREIAEGKITYRL